jgi:hypothetical protein
MSADAGCTIGRWPAVRPATGGSRLVTGTEGGSCGAAPFERRRRDIDQLRATPETHGRNALTGEFVGPWTGRDRPHGRHALGGSAVHQYESD